MADSTKNVQDEIAGIKREIKIIQWMLRVVLAIEIYLVINAYF